MLCRLCWEGIFENGTPSFPEYDPSPVKEHHKDFTSFNCSVKEGCYICNRIWKSLEPSEQLVVLNACQRVSSHTKSSKIFQGPKEETVGCIFSYRKREGRDLFSSSRLEIEFKIPFMRHVDFSLRLRKIDEYHVPAKTILGPGTKSPESFELAKKWITYCEAFHQCDKSTPAAGTWYPTRLIDCGPLAGPESCRVVESKSSFITRPYLTLSHCWGQAKCLELTVMNYNQLLNDIPLSSLPQLYKDAVYATRQLGQRYIWIDSLCIIQEGDDCKDWQTEVSLMSEVYSNSFCNIAAASASDCNHSMFSSRDRTPIEQETVSLVVNDREISSWYVFTSDRGLHDGREFWEKEVTNSLVNTRAWVVQERLLSARSLYFGPSQVYWQCDEKDAMEIWPAGIPDFVWGRRRNIKPDLKLTQGDSVIRQISDCRWQYIIQTYSTCDMTNPRDKLPAISAIAKRVRSITNDQYVVGMWLSILEQELLWSVDYECLKPRPKDYRAPSWSWAAVDGTVHSFCRNLRSEAFFTIEDWDIDYLTEDDTQQVKGGWLRLRGRLMEMTLMENTLYRNFKAFTSWVNGLQISYVRLDTIHDAFDQENADGSLYCLPTMVNKSEYYLSDKDERAHKAPPRLSFLVLQIVDREKGVFSRLGICENDFYRDEIDDLLGYREGEEDFPCEKYEDGYHHIRII